MNWASWLVWGFAATVVLTTILAGSQGAGLTRMNIPFLLGTMVSARRDRAKLAGAAIHLVNGWLFALVYIAAFHQWDGPDPMKGIAIGAVHSLFVLAVGMPVLPALHPRMANEQHGPDAPRMLEPPGFFAMHYGGRTPLTIVLAHLVFGAILGAFYRPL